MNEEALAHLGLLHQIKKEEVPIVILEIGSTALSLKLLKAKSPNGTNIGANALFSALQDI
jgi:hypothetical protein